MLPDNLYITLVSQWQSAILPLCTLAWFISAALSFAVGANDCANSFGTAVGSNSLTVNQACNLAAFFETFGAIFMSAAVGATIRKGVFNGDVFRSFDTKKASLFENKCEGGKYSHHHGNYRCLEGNLKERSGVTDASGNSQNPEDQAEESSIGRQARSPNTTSTSKMLNYAKKLASNFNSWNIYQNSKNLNSEPILTYEDKYNQRYCSS